MKVNIGEARAKVVIGIDEEKTPKVVLRANRKFVNKSKEVVFEPAEELKYGDEIKVTIEKISAAPKADSKA